MCWLLSPKTNLIPKENFDWYKMLHSFDTGILSFIIRPAILFNTQKELQTRKIPFG